MHALIEGFRLQDVDLGAAQGSTLNPKPQTLNPEP